VLYTVDPSGAVTPTTKPDRVVEHARRWQMSILPVIQNLRGGGWDGATITAILNDQQRRAHHIQAIMDMVHGSQDWNGVDIDYEQLDAADSAAYLAFLRLLATDLHHRHKLLAVAVPAKTAESAEDPQSQAYPYDQIASVADEIRVMAYDHAWEESPPGSVAPTPWVQQVLNYALRSVPRSKLMLGIAAYGYDWADGRGRPLGATFAAALAAQHRATVSWDETSASAWFRYTSGGTAHTVWFENAQAMASKVQLATKAGARGVTIWKLGDEDPAFWTSATTN
jgi:spore germination protein YaaH